MRRIIVGLVLPLPLLLVAFAILIAGYALAAGTGEATAAAVLWWVAMSVLVLAATDLVLLVAALGASAAGFDRLPPDESASGRDDSN